MFKCGLHEPDVQEARIGHSQPGVGLWSTRSFVLNLFKSGRTLNPHNKRHSFGLFISLYLCCVVDCINICALHYFFYKSDVILARTATSLPRDYYITIPYCLYFCYFL